MEVNKTAHVHVSYNFTIFIHIICSDSFFFFIFSVTFFYMILVTYILKTSHFLCVEIATFVAV